MINCDSNVLAVLLSAFVGFVAAKFLNYRERKAVSKPPLSIDEALEADEKKDAAIEKVKEATAAELAAQPAPPEEMRLDLERFRAQRGRKP